MRPTALATKTVVVADGRPIRVDESAPAGLSMRLIYDGARLVGTESTVGGRVVRTTTLVRDARGRIVENPINRDACADIYPRRVRG